MDRTWDRPIAHRGLHGRGTPENSLPAIAAARRLGLGIEIDVRVTADGVAVVHHDVDLMRMCSTPGRVADLTCSQVTAQRLTGTEHSVPTLGAALDLIGGDVPVLIDCKVRPTSRDRIRMLRAVMHEVRAYQGPVGVVSFDPWFLARVMQHAPGVVRGQSAGVALREARIPHQLRRATAPLDTFWFNHVSQPHFLNYNIERLPQPVLGQLRDRGMKVMGWTVRHPEQLAASAHLVDNVIAEGDAMDLLLRRPEALAG
ncbi:MAG: glycerophosphodiester phosphodiesterase [Actinomycetota bacterium]|nr:glycerophosphodiester phosphodiesterase [Actinomycetota bacterium]